MTKTLVGVAKDFEILESRDLSRGFFRFEELSLRHQRFDGGQSRVLSRERMHIGSTVIVLPYDWRRDEVLLIEQFRPGACGWERGPWMIECVAGMLDVSEEPMVAAKRELNEEAGLIPHQIEAIGCYAPNPAVTTEYANMFIADCDLSDAGGIHGLVDEDEDIKSYAIKADEAFGWIDDGSIICANALLPLRWLQVHRPALKKRWQKAASV